MFEFQEAGIEFLRAGSRRILGDEMGLGKTRQALMAAEGRTLVVVSGKLKGEWLDEIERWRPDLEVEVTNYWTVCDKERTPAGGFRHLPRARGEWVKGFDTVILDEVHNIKGRQTMRTKAIRQICRKVDRVSMLTGTPIPNWAHELFVMLQICDPKEYSSYWRWVESWFKIWRPPWGGTEIRGLHDYYGWDDFAESNHLGEWFLRREWDTVADELPPLIESTVECPMTLAQRKLYDTLKADYVAWTAEGDEISAWSAGGLHTKLAQVATGLESAGMGVGSGKLDMLVELMEERRHLATVIFTQFRATAVAAQRRLTEMGIPSRTLMGGMTDREVTEIKRAWQTKGQFPVLIGTLDTLAEGFTLTRADTVIMVERSWKPSRNEQARKRIHRIGQTRPCQVITLLTSGSVDDGMTGLLAEKGDQQIKVLSAAQLARIL